MSLIKGKNQLSESTKRYNDNINNEDEILLKDNKGVTLVGVVVTVIVLLILARVSIGYLFDADGLFQKANFAATKYNEAKEEEGNILNKLIHEYEEDKVAKLRLSETEGTIVYPNTRTFEVIENTSDGALSVSSSDDSIASASIEGTTVTVTSKAITESEKEAIITVKSAATEEYKEQTATYTATVMQGGIIIEATAYEGDFDGQSHPALTKVTVIPEDAKLKYSLNGGGYTEEIPQVNGAGTYTVSIIAERAGYITKEMTKTIEIQEKIICAGLNGTELRYYASAKNAQKDGCTTIYENITGNLSANWDGSNVKIPWIATGDMTNTTITSVNIVDEIHPTSAECYFYGLQNVTTIKNLSNLKTDDVVSMRLMFAKCSGLQNIDLSSFNTSNVNNMDAMFYECSSLTTLNFSTTFNTSNVTNMNSMLAGCSNLTSLNVSNLNTNKVTKMNSMFSSCHSLTSLDVSSFDMSNVTDMGWMFNNCRSLTTLKFSEKFATAKVVQMRGLFSDCYALQTLTLPSTFTTDNVTNMSQMFQYCHALTTINSLNNFNTTKVTDMNNMFNGCKVLTTLNLSSFNTSNVTNMASMFSDCQALTTLTLPNSFNTSKVTNMSDMFYSCLVLTSLNLNGFNTVNVTTMYRMFYNCKAITNLSISTFNTAKVTNMYGMFGDCQAITSLSFPTTFTTNNVTDMGLMFYNCRSLTNLNLSKFNTSKVTNMAQMLQSLRAMQTLDISNFDVSNVVTYDNMLKSLKSTATIRTNATMKAWINSKFTDIANTIVVV